MALLLDYLVALVDCLVAGRTSLSMMNLVINSFTENVYIQNFMPVRDR